MFNGRLVQPESANDLTLIARGTCPRCGNELHGCSSQCHWECTSRACGVRYEIHGLAHVYVQLQIERAKVEAEAETEIIKLVSELIRNEVVTQDNFDKCKSIIMKMAGLKHE